MFRALSIGNFLSDVPGIYDLDSGGHSLMGRVVVKVAGGGSTWKPISWGEDSEVATAHIFEREKKNKKSWEMATKKKRDFFPNI